MAQTMFRLAIGTFVAATLAACGGGGGGGGGTGNQGSNLFAGGATVAVGGSSTLSDVALADVNEDGSLDLLVVSESTGNLSIALGEQLGGSGHFGSPTDIAIGGSLTAVVAADFDADGDVDVAVADADADRIVVLSNDGSGNLSISTQITLGLLADPEDLEAFDLDCDGRLDLVATLSGVANVAVALGTGGGLFGLPSLLTLPLTFDAEASASGDFDMDGDLDLAVASGSLGSVQVLLLDGSGGVVTSTNVLVDAGESLTGIASADVDADGDLDLVVVESTEGDVYVLENDGSGSFSLGGEFEAGAGASGIVAADFDLDGNVDVAVGAGNRVAVLLGNGDATFAEVRTFPASGNTAVAIATGDLNCDGSLDLVNANSVNGTVGVLLGRRHVLSAEFGTAVEIPLAVGFDTADVVLADVNADGDIDVLLANRTAGSLAVALGDGDGTFGSVVQVSGGAGVQALALATGDVDMDGDLDVAMALGTGAGVAVFWNDGNGTFTLAGTVATGAGTEANDVLLADFDLDCDLDMAIAVDDSIQVALGNGDGTFAPPTSIALTAGFQASAVATLDLNDDGKLDLVATSSFDGTVAVALGTGTGAFGSPAYVTVDAGEDLSAIVAGDVDCDGDVDLVVANATDGTIRVLRNDGSGNLTVEAAVAATADVSAIALVDLDRDGDLDVVVASETSAALRLLVNGGTGTFSSAGTFATSATGSVAIAMADLDGDGQLDAVTANLAADASASVLINAGS